MIRARLAGVTPAESDHTVMLEGRAHVTPRSGEIRVAHRPGQR
jgi:hypothetical protein